ncbi:receptor-type tyrosine-protein phosphatase F-like [Actinia tenebrosa]|uniref:Receptor-type tyrosine-protein phosphatase F-like n=1 Tax=Actinia tenebrosa TaxID=6105 RepID=A0A6P8I7F9_ACTTE|nr:receptor-type tyrosine-protein phosphatase F-like [Actinia tenebrosa]
MKKSKIKDDGFDCGNDALGMQNNITPAHKITASSGIAGDQARLNYTHGPPWCAMGNDDNPYLQIDLGTPHIICAVSTQGDHQKKQWVKTFRINYSDDGKTYQQYKDNSNTQQIFHGNVDGSGIVKQILYHGITARYLRILPMMHHGAVCMRAEIYGIQMQSENLAIYKISKQSSTSKNGIASRAVDGNRDGNWLSGSCTLCDQRHDREWWRVDLGKSVEVEEVSVFTRTHPQWGLRLWNTTFELRIGDSSASPTSNPTCGGQYGIIPAGSITIVCSPPMKGRYVSIRQLEPYHQLSLCEVEIYGHENSGLKINVVDNKTNETGCANAARKDNKTWLMIDLDHIIPVYKIYIHTLFKIPNIKEVFQIQIGNNYNKGGTFNPSIIYGHPKSKDGYRHYIVLSHIMIGRYLTIQGRGVHKGLCKVEVYSKAPVCTRQGVGISNNQTIPDNKLTASSIHSTTRSAHKARLLGNSSWRPSDRDANPWLQVDLGKIYYLCAVATQGDPNGDERTRKYKISWSLNGTWQFLKNKTSKAIMIFTGNRDSISIIKHTFTSPLKAKMIRFYPVEKNKANALRVEIYGVNIQGPQTPSLTYDRELDPRFETHIDLVCRADGGLNIKWYHNDTDITSYSIGTVRTGSILISTLRVNYTSADDILENYFCGKAFDRNKICSSLEYICQVDYGSYRKLQARRSVTTVVLGVLDPPIVQIKPSSRSALVMIIPNITADQGNITKYSIDLDWHKRYLTNLSTYHLTDLKPYTNYTVRVMVSSQIGKSEWSKTVTFTTLQAEPSAAPENVTATEIASGKFNIFWNEIPQDDANGKIVAYEVKWKPVKLRRKRSPLTSSQANNATKSPHVLDNLTYHVTYSVSIRGYTVAGPGPFSIPITIRGHRGTGTDLKDGPVSFLLIITVAASVVAAVIIIVTSIVIIVLIKRHKNPKVKRVHYAARASQLNAQVSMIEDNEEKDEQSENNKEEIEDATSSGVKYGNSLSHEATLTNRSFTVNQFIQCMRKVPKEKNQILTKEFQNMGNGLQFPSLVARKAANKTKNRYGNIVPYDHSRVVLEKVEEDEDSDYINASYIRGYEGRHISYIASQGPVERSVVDFWRMIWQEKTSVIVMLTDLIEGSKTKCKKYWPEDCEKYFDISVQLQKTEIFADYSIRSFYLTKTRSTEQRCVFQYHFTAWPDKDVPHYATQLLAFRRRLVSDTAMVSPWVVHCSAGVGRTGTFLAVDAMLRQAEEKKTLDIFNYVKTMRENRPYMVQTTEQYIFVHTAIHEFLTCGITEIEALQLREEMEKLVKTDEKENLSGYEMEFKHLSHVCPLVQDDEMTDGNKPCNNRKNRFSNILPLDKARVFVQVYTDEEGANYINASYANGYRHKNAYILTQAPLDTTIADFWRMIYDNKLGTIVMLNNLQEGNVNYPKYWPQEVSQQYGDIIVDTIKEEEKTSVTLRTFTLTSESCGSDGVHEVRHYQHTDWSDGSVPSNVRTVLDLIEMLQWSQQQSGNKSIVVQCSDGVGRSGTLCTILSLLDRVKTEQMVDVFQTVKALRISRPGAVETATQYQFCFQVVMDYVESFSEYSNFDG